MASEGDRAAGFILPDPEDPESAGFWAGTARGELCIQRCADCALRRMPPRPMCPACRSLRSVWAATSGRATIWSFAVPHPPLLPAYSALAPYNAILVSLDDDPGIRLVGNLVRSAEGAINEIDPATIRIGESVEVVFARVDNVCLPRWKRTDGS